MTFTKRAFPTPTQENTMSEKFALEAENSIGPAKSDVSHQWGLCDEGVGVVQAPKYWREALLVLENGLVWLFK
jgi:hypothetical protein